MLKKVLGLVSLVSLVTTSIAAFGSTVKLPPDDKVLKLIGAMNPKDGLNLAMSITDRQKEPELFLLINSPGGAVIASDVITDAIKNAKVASGTKFTCIVGALAASAAFSVLIECDRRVTLENTKLLFHYAAIQTMAPVTEQGFQEEILEDLHDINETLLEKVSSAVGKDKKWVDSHMRKETLWRASRLQRETGKWFEIVDAIENANSSLFQVFKPSSFFMMGGITHIMKEFLRPIITTPKKE